MVEEAIPYSRYFDLILISTCQDSLHIGDFINSIISYNKSLKIYCFVILQDTSYEFYNTNELVQFNLIIKPKMGLSKARNIGLAHLLEQNISAKYIMFPDDDTTFDNSIFENLLSKLNEDKCYLTPIYVHDTKDYYLGKNTKKETEVYENQFRLVGSPNQILLYEKFKKHIYFDEKLGVGAKYGSSEDLDLFIRLNLNGASYFYTNKLYSYHPAKISKYNIPIALILKRFISYSKGYCFVILKYRKLSKILNFLLRPVAASIIFFLKLKFKLSASYFCLFFIRIYLLILFSFQPK